MPAEALAFRLGAGLLCLFTLAEVNYPLLAPQSQLAFFALIGLVLVFLKFPFRRGAAATTANRLSTAFLCLATLLAFGYIFTQVEPRLHSLWLNGVALGARAGAEAPLDFWVGLIGLILVLEAARRAVGPALPLLALLFLLYAAVGPALPDWLFPHRGYPWQRIVSQTFLQSQGVFGIALRVMFTYVFLFVLFGALLERTGATDFILSFSRRLLGQSAGGPAKVAVLSSGLMGSLSGSAVANTATTGTFTIPLMRAAGFRPAVAAGVEAAASSGGALVPPIMGAGAYMMLEMVDPPVTYLAIVRAALIPALLYYISLLLVVHLLARRLGANPDQPVPPSTSAWPGAVFFAAFAALILFLLLGYTPFRAVTLSLVAMLLLAACHKSTRVGPSGLLQALERAAHGGVALVAAAACVGTLIGVVTLTGIGAKLPGVLLPLAQDSLPAALVLLMVSTIILGMGLPSAVCYLLMATLVGPVLADLGPAPLAGHFFIFYFGMMSMVTPPVALAAYTAAAIAASEVLPTGWAAFRFALVGFALPFAFVLRPELLLLAPGGEAASWGAVLLNISTALAGIALLAMAVAGYGRSALGTIRRLLLLPAAGLLLLVPPTTANIWWLLAAAVLGLATLLFSGSKDPDSSL
ncbi:MAG: TRAP transporter fused permease subunit [Candidatus Latescibacteria bacterium]|nr:TRAP transporter fused permease subunit [Candidatus Latescibacterota bacterium]